jgi:predicted aspartyl protease
MPSNTHNAHVTNPLKTEELFSIDPSDDPNRANTQATVIRCQRAGMHLKVPVTLDIHGVKINAAMILDTGASVTVLAKSLYSQGLAKPLDSLPRIRMKTANGMITCPVDTLEISASTYTNKIPVALTNDSTSLLGANYFAGHRITMDLKNECIYIHP